MDVRADVVEALPQQQMALAVDAVVFQVLDNPSLREEILKHVIFGKDGVDRKAACDLRRVDKSWNESVLRVLWKSHKHLFRLGARTTETFDRFVSTFAVSAEVIGSMPPLTIHCFLPISKPENMEKFWNYLARCRDGLIQLGFRTIENGRPFEDGLQNWSLPFLHKLEVQVGQNFIDHPHEEQGQGAVNKTGENLSTCLIKSVMSKATALTELSLTIHSNGEVPPEGSQFVVFDSVILPPSITKIKMTIVVVSAQHLEILARSPLLNLASLSIYVRNSLLPDGLLFRILDNCRKSLKTLEIDSRASNGAAYLTPFPTMEHLRELSITGVEPHLEHDESLKECFPKLAILNLLRESDDVLQVWAGYPAVAGVTSLKLSLLLHWIASLTIEAMQLVNFGFPNLRKLQVDMTSRDTSGLRYIFLEMRQLTELAINVDGYGELATFPNTWDSILTGVPVNVVALFRADPTFLEKSELEKEGVASIRNLSELRRFSFACYHRYYRDGFIRVTRLSISDFLFNCALLRMPKLKELRLQRASTFNVSQEMMAKWRNDGRTIDID